MSKIKSFNRGNLKGLRDVINYELEALGGRLGITLHAGNATFEESEVTFKLKVMVEEISGDNAELYEFEKSMSLFGLTTEDFGRTLETFSGTYTLCGLKPRSPKYPILGRCVKTGKRFKLPRRVIEASSGTSTALRSMGDRP